MPRRRHTIGAAHDHRAPRHGGLIDRRQRAHAVAHDPGLLGLQPDLEPGDIDEVDHGQVEGFGHVQEAGEFLRRGAVPAAAVVVRVAGDHGHGPAVQPGQPGDDGAAPVFADLEEGVLIDQRLHDRPDLVDLTAFTGDGGEQPFVAAARVVGRRAARRQLVHGRRQVGQEAAGPVEGFLLARHLVIDHAVAGVDLAAPEFVLLQDLADARHHRRPGVEQLRGALDHHRVMAGRHARRAHAGHRTQRQRHHRHHRHVLHHVLPHLHGRDVGVATVLDIAHRAATARAIDQPHHRQAQVVGHLLGVDQLVAHRAVVGAAAHGEVIPHQHGGSAIQMCATHHQIGRGQAHQPAIAVVLAATGERTHLAEAAGVRDGLDALAHGELARVLVALDLVGSAKLGGQSLAIGQFVDFRLPGHVSPLCLRAFGYGCYPRANALPVPAMKHIDFIAIFSAGR
ncbi:hypothetical protein D3C81_811640 [compost metagenome]